MPKTKKEVNDSPVKPLWDIPQGWKWVRLMSVANLISGCAFPKDLQGKQNGDYPFAKVKDI